MGCYRSYVQISTHCGIGEKWESRNSYNKSKAKGLVEMFQIDLHVQGPTSSSLILATWVEGVWGAPPYVSSLFTCCVFGRKLLRCNLIVSFDFRFTSYLISQSHRDEPSSVRWPRSGSRKIIRSAPERNCPTNYKLALSYYVRMNKSNDGKTIQIFAENRWEWFLKCSMEKSNSVIICNVQ